MQTPFHFSVIYAIFGGRRLCLTGSIWVAICLFPASAQRWLVPADTLSASRLGIGLSVTGVSAVVATAGLYRSWYSRYEQSPFHYFNDWDEWRNLDKAGHVQSTYSQTALLYQGCRWGGLGRKKALLTGLLTSMLFQSTIEVMDGFSEKWGFSVPDMTANLIGAGWFAWQELTWGEQRFQLRFLPGQVSHSRQRVSALAPSAESTSPYDRAVVLFGNSAAERWLKDYNGHTYWLSIQIRPWLAENSRWPAWLNAGIGFSASNMYGGFSNQWQTEGAFFDLSQAYPRTSRFFFGPDIGLAKLGFKKPWLKTLTYAMGTFRVPMPCIEWNTRGEWVFHLLR